MSSGRRNGVLRAEWPKGKGEGKKKKRKGLPQCAVLEKEDPKVGDAPVVWERNARGKVRDIVRGERRGNP